MDVTQTTGWWTCSDCGAEAELPDLETTGFRLACPDCEGVLVTLWSWETVIETRTSFARAA